MNTTQSPEGYLDKKGLARKLKCTTRHIDNLTTRGIIPKIKVGQLSRYDWNDVSEALKNGKGDA